ncbi:MAG: hypothetical protein JNK05_23925 [Myxococcales bacterium]|nr:hypothetical protein [Myxococcales bacterium]
MRLGSLLSLVALACSACSPPPAPQEDAAPRDVVGADTITERDSEADASIGPDVTVVERDVAAMSDSATVVDAASDVVVVDAPRDTRVPVFVAQGHMGRITVSCDDGRTWVGNRSSNDAARCFTGGLDCDHNATAGRGLAYGNGYFVATFGWGTPGVVRRSNTGLTWEDTLPGRTFADVAFGNGVFLANERTLQRSSDGTGWRAAGDTTAGPWNVRTIEFIAHGPRGRFLVSAESGTDRDIVWSADNGTTWQRARTRPPECGQSARGFAYGNGVAILTSGAGHACRSTDGGESWTRIAVAMGELTTPVWTGSEFFAWEGSRLWRSADGMQWTSTPLVGTGLSIGAVARSPSGTFVAVRGGWQVWYDQQRFYRSTDGIRWETLAAGTFVGSHPINFIEFGYAPAGTMCPTR